ncbi:unnamed protein product [Chironomus riparius]|uniref:Uncharacterized protein n=1 Tax=Chironomus riparius TaxID=315576 RepID=A0A9N9WXR8_9DIPT|nr:unnamed protein product [Chironomus riparius]
MITVTISNSRLPCFPCNIDKFFELIQFLNISNSTIKKFSLNDLEGFTNLKNVSLDGNNITEFETKSGSSIVIYLKNNNIMFDSNSISSSNTTKLVMIIIVLVILLIGTNAALLIKIRKNSQITTNVNSDTELSVIRYEEVNKNLIYNPLNGIKIDNLYSEVTNYEELVSTKAKDFGHTEVLKNITNSFSKCPSDSTPDLNFILCVSLLSVIVLLLIVNVILFVNVKKSLKPEKSLKNEPQTYSTLYELQNFSRIQDNHYELNSIKNYEGTNDQIGQLNYSEQQEYEEIPENAYNRSQLSNYADDFYQESSNLKDTNLDANVDKAAEDFAEGYNQINGDKNSDSKDDNMLYS